MLKARLIFILLFLYGSHVLAYGLLSDTERDLELKKVAKQNVETAKQEYLKRFHECFVEGEKITVSVGDLQKKGLTEAEAKVALLYLSAKNFKSCMGNIADSYSIAVNLARYFNVQGFSVEDDPDLGNSRLLADVLAIDEMKFRVDYFKIDQAKREILEKDSKLQKVFSIKR